MKKLSEEHKQKIRVGNLGKPKPKPKGFKNSGTFGQINIEKHREIAKKARKIKDRTEIKEIEQESRSY